MKLKDKLRRAIKRHVVAQVDLSWIGTRFDPADMDDIKNEAVEAQIELREVLKEVILHLPPDV